MDVPDQPGLSRRALLAGGGLSALLAAAAIARLGGAADAATPDGAAKAGAALPSSLPTSGSAPAAYSSLPDQLGTLGSSRQVVIVRTTSYSTHHGTIEAWDKASSGIWTRRLSPSHANIGLDGFVLGTDRIQGDMKTPAGTYRIHKGFGHYSDPGTRLPYRLLNSNDYWAGDQKDPKTYNTFQSSHPATAKWRTSQSEALYYTMPAYRYVACIDFNLALGLHRLSDGQEVATTPANTKIGSGIFLHTYGVTGWDGYTEGCVATSEARLIWLLRWFDPAAYPRIVMGPDSYLASL